MRKSLIVNEDVHSLVVLQAEARRQTMQGYVEETFKGIERGMLIPLTQRIFDKLKAVSDETGHDVTTVAENMLFDSLMYRSSRNNG